MTVNFSVTSFVHKLFNRLEIGVSPGDIRLDNSQHVDGGFVELDEDSIVDLQQTEQLQYFPYFGGNFVDTEKITIIRTSFTTTFHHNSPSDPDNKGQFGFSRNIVVSTVFSLSDQPDFLAFLQFIFFEVFLGPFENILAFLYLLRFLLDGALNLNGPSQFTSLLVF